MTSECPALCYNTGYGSYRESSPAPLGRYLYGSQTETVEDTYVPSPIITESCLNEPSPSSYAYNPSARTKLILNRVALSPARSYAPPPRMVPRMAPPPPPYYDDYYGYGGGYAPYYGGAPPQYAGASTQYAGASTQYAGAPSPYAGGYGYAPPRYSAYNPYLEEDYGMYTPRYRPTSRLTDSLLDLEKAKSGGDDPAPRKVRTRLRAIEAPTETEGDRHLARMSHKYPSLSEPQMLQDQVDKMRIRLKTLAFSLDPSGPVPEIVIPERSRRVDGGEDFKKKYSSALEVQELPRLSTRRHHYYPEDEHMKDNLRIKCLSHYKSTRTQAGYWKPKGYYGDQVSTYSLPSVNRYASAKGSDSAKWEEPDKVYATSSTTERKPYSKASDVTEDEDAKKERRKKKKSKERDDLSSFEATATPSIPETPEVPVAAPSEAAPEGQVSCDVAAPTEPEGEMDEKERKRLEKRKRKAEREAAAKAAMEAELAALAAAEAELAKLDAESAGIKDKKSSVAEPVPSVEDQASEKDAPKCESPVEGIPPCDDVLNELECTPLNELVQESDPVDEESIQQEQDLFISAEPQVTVEDDPVVDQEEKESEISSDNHRVIEEPLNTEEESHVIAEEPPSEEDEIIYDEEHLGTKIVESHQEPSLEMENQHHQLPQPTSVVEEIEDQEPQTVEPDHFESPSVEPDYLETTSVEPDYLEPSSIEPDYLEPDYIEPTSVEPEYLEPSSVEPDYLAPTSVEPDYLEPSVEPDEPYLSAEPNNEGQQYISEYNEDPETTAVSPQAEGAGQTTEEFVWDEE